MLTFALFVLLLDSGCLAADLGSLEPETADLGSLLPEPVVGRMMGDWSILRSLFGTVAARGEAAHLLYIHAYIHDTVPPIIQIQPLTS